MKEILQSCGYVGLLGLDLQSNKSNCLVLILHRQLGNYITLRTKTTAKFEFFMNCRKNFIGICKKLNITAKQGTLKG